MQHFHGMAETRAASLYLLKLCKHFRHKVPVTFDESEATVAFPFGQCHLTADATGLKVAGQVADGDDARRMKVVIEDHLDRFSGDETLTFCWREGPSD